MFGRGGDSGPNWFPVPALVTNVSQHQQQDHTSSHISISPSAFVRAILERQLKFDVGAWRERAAYGLAEYSKEARSLASATEELQLQAVRRALLQSPGHPLATSAEIPAHLIPQSILVPLEDRLWERTTYAALRFDPTLPAKEAAARLLSARDYIDANRIDDTHDLAGFKTLRERLDGLDFESATSAIPIPEVRVAPPQLEWCMWTKPPDPQPRPLPVGERLYDENGGYVTVGAFAEFQGRRGILTVAHGVKDRKILMPHSGQAVFNPRDAVVNDYWDAAWMPLPDRAELDHSAAALTCAENTAVPGRGRPLSFVAENTKKRAVIDSVDPILPYYDKQTVARIYTNRCTDQGDSGAVLFDETGTALGLASMRTTTDSVPAFSLWMWMPGVLQALDARLITKAQD